MQLSPAVRKLLNTCNFKRFWGNTNYKSTKGDIIDLIIEFEGHCWDYPHK